MDMRSLAGSRLTPRRGAGHWPTKPAEPALVVAFVDAQAEIKSPATVRRYLATIAHMHRAAELTDPTKAEAVRLAVKRKPNVIPPQAR